MWLYAPTDTPGHLASRTGAVSANRSPWQRAVPNTTATTTTVLVPCLLVKNILLDHESPDCFLRRWETQSCFTICLTWEMSIPEATTRKIFLQTLGQNTQDLTWPFYSPQALSELQRAPGGSLIHFSMLGEMHWLIWLWIKGISVPPFRKKIHHGNSSQEAKPNRILLLINQLFLTLQHLPEVKMCLALTNLDEVGEAGAGWGPETSVLLCRSVSNLTTSTLL